MAENDDMDVSKAKRELGRSPKVGLQEGARLTVEWLRSEGLAQATPSAGAVALLPTEPSVNDGELR